MSCGNGIDFFNPLKVDESPSLGEGLKAMLQSESHPFEQTAVNHIGEWMTIEDSTKIGDEGQPPVTCPRPPKKTLARGISAAGDKFFG
jgi:hypothetical protein